MNVSIRRIDPQTTAEPETWVGSPLLTPDNIWEEEAEGADFQPRPLATHGRWLWLGIALALTLGSVGFVGRFSPGGGVPPARSGAVAIATADADLPFTVTSPATGAMIEGATIHVQGEASEEVGTIHLGVVVGGAVIGWATIRAERPGSWEVSIPVFAPQVSIEVDLFVTRVASDAAAPRNATEMRATAIVRRTFSLRSGGPIGLWPARVLGSGVTTTVVVTGRAPIGVGHVRVRLVGHDGRLLATSVAAVTRDETRPGAAGGYALGLGSFMARLAVGQPIGKVPLRAEVDWRDEIGGGWGTSVQTIVPTESSPSRP